MTRNSVKRDEIYAELARRGFERVDASRPRSWEVPELFFCPQGHPLQIRIKAAYYKLREKGNYNCKTCLDEKRIVGPDKIAKYIESLGYNLLTPLSGNLNEDVVLHLECGLGHFTTRRLSNLKAHPNCGICRLRPLNWYTNLKENYSYIKVVEKIAANKARVYVQNSLREMTLHQMGLMFGLSLLEIWGYQALETIPKAAHLKFKCECLRNHHFTTTLRALGAGRGCPYCNAHGANEAEILLGEYIEERGYTILRRDNKILNGVKLDILIPSLRLALNVVGVHWKALESWPLERHDNVMQSQQQKLLKCREAGIQLLTFFDADFIHQREKIKEILFSALKGRGLNSLDARYCFLRPKDRLSPPKPHYFTSTLREVKGDKPHKYTVYDCGAKEN